MNIHMNISNLVTSCNLVMGKTLQAAVLQSFAFLQEQPKAEPKPEPKAEAQPEANGTADAQPENMDAESSQAPPETTAEPAAGDPMEQ